MAHRDDDVQRLVTAVLAFLDCDASWGRDDPRTEAAKASLREVAQAMEVQPNHERQPAPTLEVLEGGLADDDSWRAIERDLLRAPLTPPPEREPPEHEF